MNSSVIGQKITAVRYLKPVELEKANIDLSKMIACIELENGTKIYPTKDELIFQIGDDEIMVQERTSERFTVHQREVLSEIESRGKITTDDVRWRKHTYNSLVDKGLIVEDGGYYILAV